ncbi:MAG: nucleotidyl transferase AbiEii/AbiGii toxin family protein [Promethearchaeota archaeon]
MIYLAYIFERFLYRLSISKYRNNLILKGGVLLYCEQFHIRQTTDLDLLGYKIPNQISKMKSIMREICMINNDDALIFHVDRISIEETMIAHEYGGLKIKIPVSLTSINEYLRIDIGFNDIIYPKARDLSYPLLIRGNKSINIKVYSLESFVAEKIHSIYILGNLTSRMKDYYDLFKIAEIISFEQKVLLKAIKATFERRGDIILTRNLLNILSDNSLSELFSQYCKKKELALISFEKVTQRLKEWLLPIFQLIEEGTVKHTQIWDIHSFQWKKQI